MIIHHPALPTGALGFLAFGLSVPSGPVSLTELASGIDFMSCSYMSPWVTWDTPVVEQKIFNGNMQKIFCLNPEKSLTGGGKTTSKGFKTSSAGRRPQKDTEHIWWALTILTLNQIIQNKLMS